MLRSLHVKNYALIDELHIDFEAGFSVITGETGAGKSIILGAINLLLGQRADVKTIRIGEDKCVLEAVFSIKNYNFKPFFDENNIDYDDECILRREIKTSGKSRAFINDTPVSIATLKELGEQLIDIHSQHQNLLLNEEGFQLNVLDLISGNATLLGEYQEAYRAWKEKQKELKSLQELAEQNKADEDYIRFQLDQFAEASLKKGEKEELEQESEMLENAEDIKSSLFKLNQLLDADEVGLLSVMREVTQELSNLSSVYASAEDLAKRMSSALIEVKDISKEISYQSDNVVYDPERLQEVSNRLNVIYTLEQKYHVQTVEELLEIEQGFAEKMEAITSYDDQIAELENKNQKLFVVAKKLAEKLTVSRAHAAKKVEQELSQRLLPLGMPNVRFSLQFRMAFCRILPPLHRVVRLRVLCFQSKQWLQERLSYQPLYSMK
mgnify:FL=1